MTKKNLPIPLPEQNNALSLRRTNQLIDVTENILARSRQELAVQDESWMARLWAWADENGVIDYGDPSGMGIMWEGLPRERQCLLELHELELHRYMNFERPTTLPAEIGRLQQLEKLKLRNNNLTSLPPEIGQLQQLQELWLSSNRLTRLPPEIGQLQELEKLELDDNQLTSLPPEIGQLQKLVVLQINDNPLTTLPPEIGQLQNLQELHIDIDYLSLISPILLLKDSLVISPFGINAFSMEDRFRAAARD